jgi:hypothetical protein
MTSLENIMGTPIWYIMCLVIVIILIVQLEAFIITIGRTKGIVSVLPPVSQLFIGLLFFAFLYLSYVKGRRGSLESLGPFFYGMYQRPWVLYVLLELILLLIVGAYITKEQLFLRKNLTQDSIRETVNMLPSAICIYRENGAVLLSNIKMNELCKKITGDNLFDARTLWKAVGEKSAEDIHLVKVSEEETWLFEKRELRNGDDTLYQLIASDMTEQERIRQELEKNNNQLISVQNRLKKVSNDERKLVASRENMLARTTVHNQMGNVLLVGKYYMDNPDKMNEKELLNLLEYNNHFLIKEAEDSYTESVVDDDYDKAVRMTEQIGIKLLIEGEIPEDEMSKKILTEAIRQCAANAVRHAGADVLYVKIKTVDGKNLIRISDNGGPVKGDIKEGGGLTSLRNKVESICGKMSVESNEGFRLILEI